MTVPPSTPPGSPPDSGAPATPVTLETVKELIEDTFKGYRQFVNGDVASLRKKLEAISGSTPAGTPPQAPAAPAPGAADPESYIEIGRRLARLDDATQDRLRKEYGASPDLLRVALTAAEMVLTRSGEPTTGTGRPPPQQPTTRGGPPAPTGTGLPLPTTFNEYVAQRRDPARRAELDAMSSDVIDPTRLPRTR